MTQTLPLLPPDQSECRAGGCLKLGFRIMVMSLASLMICGVAGGSWKLSKVLLLQAH